MIDPRLQAARAAQSRAVQHSPMQQLREQAQQRQAAASRPQPGSVDDWKERFKQAAEQSGKTQKGSSGTSGILGNVVGMPLKALGMGLRGITLGTEEAAKLLPEPLEFMGGLAPFVDEDRDDDRGWRERMSDPSYGFGTIAKSTGNEWLDRGVGFAGDIALDPLTYLTLGVGKFAGGAGKLALAGKVGAAGGDEAAIKGAARLGLASMSDVQREALGIGKAGLRFGTRNHNVRVPGSGAAARGVHRGLAEAGAAIGDTAVGRLGRKLRSPERLADEIEILSGRKAGDVRAAAGRVFAEDTWRMTEGTVANAFSKSMTQWDKLKEAERVALTHAAETGSDANVAAFFDEVWQAAQDAGATGIERRANYVPHVGTSQFLDWLKDAPADLRRIFVDDSDSTGRAFARKFEPGGTYTIDGQTVTLGDASIRDINDKIGGVLGFKVMEDDIARLAKVGVMSTATDAAKARSFAVLTEQFPDLARRIEFDEQGLPVSGGGDAVGQVKDKAATKASAKRQQKNLQRLVDKTEEKITKLWDGIRSDSKAAKKAARADLQDIVDELRTVSSSSKRAIADAARIEADVPGNIGKLDDQLRRTLAATDKKLDEARSRLAVADGVAAGKEAKATAARAKFDDGVRAKGVERRVARRRILAEIEDLEQDRAVVARMMSDRSSSTMREWDEALAGKQTELLGQSGPVPRPSERGANYAEGVAERARGRADEAATKVTAAERRQQDSVKAVLDDMGVERQRGVDAAADRVAAEQAVKDAEDMIAATTADLDKVGGVNVKKKATLSQNVDEIRQVINQYDPSDPVTANVLDQLTAIQQRLVEVENLGWTQSNQRAWLAAAKAGKVQPVMKNVLADGWNRMGKELLDDADGIAMKQELAQMFQRTVNAIEDNKFWQVVDDYTKFFKSYATMTPGFHFRNALSASFMNYSDGVGTADMLDSLRYWKQYKKDPNTFLKNADPQVREAFEVIFGSGAGGSFDTAELGSKTMFGVLTDNPATRLSRRTGEGVEGPVRLAAALNTLRGGGDVGEALARVTRLQFDYSQLSQFDRKMKRIIPFWTFMSRNLPLQMQQMWLKPKAYAHYASFTRNMDAGEDGDIIPLQWREQGAFNTGLNSLGGNPLYMAPDLPHVRLKSELEKLTDPTRFLADANPALRVPAELALDRKMFTGNEFFPDENKGLYAGLNLLPLLSQIERLSGGGVSGLFGEDPEYRQEKQGQSVAGYFGLPARELTKSALEAELRRLARENAG